MLNLINNIDSKNFSLSSPQSPQSSSLTPQRLVPASRTSASLKNHQRQPPNPRRKPPKEGKTTQVTGLVSDHGRLRRRCSAVTARLSCLAFHVIHSFTFCPFPACGSSRTRLPLLLIPEATLALNFPAGERAPHVAFT